MLTNRSELEKYILSKNRKIIFDTEKCIQLYDICNEKYNIPKGIISDIVSTRMDISSTSEFILFAMLDAYDILENVNVSNLCKYFTDIEIKSFSKSKYIINNIDFPLAFNMVQVSNDQWIGTISVKELINLRNAQLIHYDVNTQRTMQRVVRGNKEFFKIKLNTKSVKSISDLLSKEQYIPNTLTLNIPTDSNAEFYYDSEKLQLVINKLDYFNITDGYHRYVAISNLYEHDADFDITMELRITNFYDDKVQRFIFQEDQKTKMSKIDSNTFNMNDSANIVCTRLNDDPRSNVKGMISRNESIIPMQDLSVCISHFYFKTSEEKNNQRYLISITKELIEDFNLLVEDMPELFEKRMNFKEISCIIYIFNLYKNKDKNKMCNTISYLLSHTDSIDKRKFSSRTIKKTLINDYDQILEGVEF